MGQCGDLALWTYVLGGGKNAAAADAIRQDSLAAADRDCGTQRPPTVTASASPEAITSGVRTERGELRHAVAGGQRVSPRPRYGEAALENLHYLLGRNTFSLSFVTRLGEHPYRHPHHRPSGADNNPEPWPGLLSGGPNPERQDAAMQKLPANLPPAKMYLDEEASYSTNEVAINWNAPLVFLLAAELPGK